MRISGIDKNHQSGAATLIVAVVLLIAITIVSLFTVRFVLNETKVEANNNRAKPALADASHGSSSCLL